jgi:hypothetical protein
MTQGSGFSFQGSEIIGQRSEIRDQRSGARRSGPAIILFCAAIALLPQMLRGPSCGHDFDFHLVSWLDGLNSWKHGILYPHWTPSPNYGAGEPRFIFYPPLTWMLGAALGLVVPWRFVPLVIMIVMLAASGLATRALARQAFNDGIATLAGCTAIFSGYALFTAYERSAFAEMTGGFWVPLLLLLMLRDPHNGVLHPFARFFGEEGGNSRTPGHPAPVIQSESSWRRVEGSAVQGAHVSDMTHLSSFRRVLNGSAFPLALIVAGAWLSNAPVGVMLSYLLAGIALILALLKKSWAPILRAAIAAALGLGLAAFFLIPAAWEQRWVAIRQAVDDPGLLIENSWLFARHADPRLEVHDIELIRVSFIAVTMVAVALAGLLVSLWRRTIKAPRRWWIPLALIPIGVLFLQLPLSEPLWNVLPKLRFLQFPWRWLVALEAPMAIFFASALWAESRRWRVVMLAGCAMAFAAATMVAGISLFQACDSEDAVSGMVDEYRAGNGFAGTDEYAPPGADDSVVPDNLPFACLVRDPAIVLGKENPPGPPDWSADQGTCDVAVQSPQAGPGTSPEDLRLHANIPQAGYQVLRLRTYPAWQIRVNGMPVRALPPRPDGLMAVPVPKGRVDLAIDWTTTRDVVAGRTITAVALLLITGLWLLEYRPFRTRLS